MILKKIVCLLIYLFGISTAFAQKWADAGIPISVAQVRTVSMDTINHKMYVGGFIPFDTNGNIAICIYDGTNWIVKDTIDNIVRAMIVYNNELYMGGDFISINSQSMEHLVKWNGSNWVNIGTQGGGILNFRIFNNELYAVGTFTQIAGINTNNIAKWNGSTWTSFNFPNPKFAGNVSFAGDCALYNGDIYVAGNFELENGPSDMAMLHNGVWQRVGNSDSIRGTFSSLNKLEVYKNELYAAGYLLHNEGNIGNGIQKWNGAQWQTVGTGLQGYNGTTNVAVGVQDMLQYKGKLYVAGGFSYAGNALAPNLASWDGIKWCAIDTLIDKPITAFGIFRDTIYVGTNSVFEGNNVNSFAKFLVGNYNYIEKCSVNFDVGVNELSNSNFVSVFPNPVMSIINIIDEQNQLQHSTIQIKNTLGQTVLSMLFQKEIDVSQLSNGIYFLQIKTEDKRLLNAKFIKQ